MSSKPLLLFHPRLWGHENQQSSWSVNAKTATGLVLCITLLSLVGWLYLTQASQIATIESHMQESISDIEKLERENALLRYQIAQLETIPRIQAKSSQLGLGPMHRKATILTVPGDFDIAEATPVGVPVGHKDIVIAAPLADIQSSFSLPSLLELWNEVKVQFETWLGK